MFTKITIQTHSKVDIIDISAKVQQAVSAHGVRDGVCFVYCPHTTAGIMLNENWDPTVERDLAMVLDRIVPQTLSYQHAEGNSPGHIKSILLGSDHFIFIRDGQLQMGRWQGVFLAEFDGPRTRTVWIKVQPDVRSG